jgi:hypothetical protein
MRRILLVIIISVVGFHAGAQQWNIGVMGGYSSTWLSNSNTSYMKTSVMVNTISTFAGSYGISVTDSLSSVLGLKLGIIYASHNEEYSGGNYTIYSSTNFDGTIKMKYLDIPLLLHFGKTDGFYFEFGPQISILLSANEDGTINNIQAESNQDYSSDFNGLLLMGVVGAGMNISLTDKVSLNLGFRGGYGFTDVTNLNSTSSNHSIPYAIASGQFFGNAVGYSPTTRIYGSVIAELEFAIP